MAHRRSYPIAALAFTAGLVFAATASASAGQTPVDTHFAPLASTVPANGDVNPYGVAVVPASVGALHRGSVLVSNFNDSANAQGTGTTIVQVSPTGKVTTFAQLDAKHLPGACPGGVGLTTALAVLRSGWVVVGSLPTADGSSATAQAGCLIVLDSHGKARETLTGYGINGPWDMTAADYGDHAQLFVSNVLNGTVAANGATVDRGTVLRIDLAIPYGHAPYRVRSTVIGSGFPERTDPAALVVGPTGVGLAGNGTLYVADTAGNRVAAIPDATGRHGSDGTGSTLTSGGALNGPLGLIIGPHGTVLTVNGGDGLLVATAANGKQVQTVQLDSQNSPPGAGALFGLAHKPGTADDLYFVDDNANTLNILN
ncbi:MAG TPA: hypothetical protein VL551_02650 [Actinospica sp.]|jgi:hypothetical protein|nr:hypothetical protein [Actinospica sp.]